MFNIYDSTTMVTVGSLPQGTHFLSVGPLHNPMSASASSYFGMCILYNNVNQACHESLGRVFFSFNPQNLVNPKITASSPADLNKSNSWIFKFTLSKSYPESLYSFRFTFPYGFNTRQIYCEVRGLSYRVDTTSVLHNQRIGVCSNIKLALQGEQQVIVGGMIAPAFSGTMKGF